MNIAKLAVLAATAFSLALGSAQAADELRIASQPIPSYAPIFLANKKGWLTEELAKIGDKSAIKLATFAAGPPINESFAAGQQDYGFLGDTPAIIGKSAGLDTSLIGKASVGPKSLAVLVAANSALKSPSELKGRKVAVTKGSYAHHLLALVLQQGGLGFGDIELINLPNGDIPGALIAGSIDAGAVWEPVITKFESQKAVRVLADGTGIKTGVLTIVAANDVIKKKPEQVKAVLRAYARAAEYIRTQPRQAAEEVTTEVNLAPDLLVQVFAKFDYDPSLRDQDISELKKSAEFMKSIGLIKTDVDIDAFADRSINKLASAK
ncbi:MAG: aliphatic sulfonate ABC transporter substrate-binding protein [Magnetospirillum sp.]|nr:aliphatic sulfonate ABC transporter substrate-binding protein [Magnetospirillum sp.]